MEEIGIYIIICLYISYLFIFKDICMCMFNFYCLLNGWSLKSGVVCYFALLQDDSVAAHPQNHWSPYTHVNVPQAHGGRNLHYRMKGWGLSTDSYNKDLYTHVIHTDNTGMIHILSLPSSLICNKNYVIIYHYSYIL